ncbi:hypothetical protein [Vibrio parahaemolyticus]|uniref:hypothetical protein n=1 Tax=Vibrio parahaemolyticus TaxID=670 RepID=UPI00193F2D1F|nr:hypothetical protein [Vibrio parahaemolyticus]MBM4917725.1 hypothetical protein [Vibrio parahaemolyticus]HCG7239828.1 hypothetical protein [Vibrio parahaemolyticus]HCG9187923.1 hypothetical protein [Vibrio parahaemolyticus]
MKCGLIMPISSIDGCSEAHWDQVREIIKEALEDTEFDVELVSDSSDVGIIQKRIVQNIYDNEIVVCDVSCKNPNVMFELGMRLAFDKPTIIIKDDVTNYSFDTSPIEHIEYPRDLHYHSIKAFKTRLKDKVKATFEASKSADYTTFLGHFGQFVVAKIDEKEVGKEDYLLKAIGDLQKEVASVRKAVNPTKRIVSTKDFAKSISEFNANVNNTQAYMTPEDFVQLYLFERIGTISLAQLQAIDSEEFEDMFQEYLHKYNEYAVIKDRHQPSVRKGLEKAVLAFKS